MSKTTGRGREKVPKIERIKCTFDDCYEHFDNLVDMKRHKKYSEKHDYCKLCNLDFPDWDSLSAHNAQWSGQDIFGMTKRMYAWEKTEKSGEAIHGVKGAIFYEKRQQKIAEMGAKGQKYGELKFHDYGCKFCGEIFKTIEARDLHLNRVHPIDQKIACPGCQSMFPRAAGLMFHLEQNRCSTITAAQFNGYLQHKGIIARLLEDPTMMERMALKDFTPYKEAAEDDEEEGGVVLDMLDGDDGDVSLAPTLMEAMVPHKRAAPAIESVDGDDWPSLSAASKTESEASAQLTASMGALAIKYGNSQQEQKQKVKVAVEPWPLPGDFKAGDTLPTSPPPWSSGATTKERFKGAKQTPATPDWDALLKVKEETDQKTNLLHHQFWNPAHRDFDPERFYDPMIERYRCPFPACEKVFRTPSDNNRHISEDHAIRSVRCPCCLKSFNTFTGLVAHCESVGSRCRVSSSDKFGQAIDRFSGGFLAANLEARPDITIEEDGTMTDFMKYSSTVPPDFVQNGEEKRGEVVGRKYW